MTPRRTSHHLLPTPGEVAFDQCFFPLAGLFVSGVIATALTFVLSPPAPSCDDGQSALGQSSPSWLLWLLFATGLTITFLWVQALFGILRVWRDPSARILRFSALGLLVPLAALALRLLLLPFSR